MSIKSSDKFNARYSENLKVGDRIRIWGRIQSRNYQKKVSEDEVTTRTAYEVSISKMEVCNAETGESLEFEGEEEQE